MAQGAHAPAEEAAWALEYLPEEQGLHALGLVLLAAAENVPPQHAEQAVAPAAE